MGLDDLVFWIIAVAMVGTFCWWAIGSAVNLRRSGYRPVQPPALDLQHTFDPEGSVTFTGGARIGGANATLPLAKLTVDGEVALVQATLIGQAWVSRADVKMVRAIGRTPFAGGVRFDTDTGDLDGLIFWTGLSPQSANNVLDRMASLGWPVSRANPGSQVDQGLMR